MVGDIVWAPFQFTDLKQQKVRAVLVLADVTDGNELDWIVCEITTGKTHAREIKIDPSDIQPKARSNTLSKRNSRIRPDRLATLDQSTFKRTVGSLTTAKLAEVLAAVKALF